MHDNAFNSDTNPAWMLTEVRKSNIHGFGLFAKVDIPKGRVWWHGRREDVLLLDRKQYETLTRSQRSQPIEQTLEAFLMYSYYGAESDELILCLDNSRFVNHSFEPNSGALPGGDPLVSLALRDIAAGEEIVENYMDYARCPWATLRWEFMRADATGS
jgi:SET domain-containing protein